MFRGQCLIFGREIIFFFYKNENGNFKSGFFFQVRMTHFGIFFEKQLTIVQYLYTVLSINLTKLFIMEIPINWSLTYFVVYTSFVFIMLLPLKRYRSKRLSEKKKEEKKKKKKKKKNEVIWPFFFTTAIKTRHHVQTITAFGYREPKAKIFTNKKVSFPVFCTWPRALKLSRDDNFDFKMTRP